MRRGPRYKPQCLSPRDLLPVAWFQFPEVLQPPQTVVADRDQAILQPPQTVAQIETL